MDNVSKKKRSQIMRLVRSKDTKLEIKFRTVLKKLGYKFRKNVINYFGKPDFVLSKFKTVIFIDSCFGMDVTIIAECLIPVGHIGKLKCRETKKGIRR